MPILDPVASAEERERQKKAKHQAVLNVVEGELRYQSQTEAAKAGRRRAPSEYLHAIQAAVNSGLVGYIFNVTDDDCMNAMRVIAALAIECMELHGAKERQW